MLYTGGNCSQSTVGQDIPCLDFGSGPPVEPGTESYILVTANEVTYHAAWVPVGSQYSIQDPSDGVLPPFLSVIVSTSEEVTPDNVLQSLLFFADCSEPLVLKDQIGASQLLAFTVNGETTEAFFDANIALEVSVSDSSPGVILKQLFSESNFGLFNLTENTTGTVIDSGNSFDTSFTVTLDLTVSGDATFLSTVTAETSPGAQCDAVSFLSIAYGPIEEQNILFHGESKYVSAISATEESSAGTLKVENAGNSADRRRGVVRKR